MVIEWPTWHCSEPWPWLALITETALAAATCLEDEVFYVARLDEPDTSGEALVQIDRLHGALCNHLSMAEAAARGVVARAWTHRTVSGRAAPPPKPIISARQVAICREIAAAARGVADLLDGWVPLETPGVRLGLARAALADIAKQVRIVVAQHAGLLGSVPGYPTPRLSRAWRNDLGVKLPGVTRSPRSKRGVAANKLRIKRAGRGVVRDLDPSVSSIDWTGERKVQPADGNLPAAPC